MNTYTLKRALSDATGCDAQHNGWPCGTCFFAMVPYDSGILSNADWQNVLLFRGDYEESTLDNLPDDKEESLEKVLRVANLVNYEHLLED